MDPLVFSVVGIIFTVGAAWGGAKVALNGTKLRVRELHEAFHEHTEGDMKVQRETVERLTALETKIDLLLKDKGLH